MLTRVTFLAGLLALVLGAAAQAHEFKLGDLVIDHPWARATIGGMKNGAAYMTLANNGAAPDRLVAVSGDVADRVELHSHLMDGGVMRMRPVDAVEIAPGTPTLLKPGGIHVMLIGLKEALLEGDRFAMTLTFERAGSIQIEVAVEAPTQTEPPSGLQHKHGS